MKGHTGYLGRVQTLGSLLVQTCASWCRVEVLVYIGARGCDAETAAPMMALAYGPKVSSLSDSRGSKHIYTLSASISAHRCCAVGQSMLQCGQQHVPFTDLEMAQKAQDEDK